MLQNKQAFSLIWKNDYIKAKKHPIPTKVLSAFQKSFSYESVSKGVSVP